MNIKAKGGKNAVPIWWLDCGWELPIRHRKTANTRAGLIESDFNLRKDPYRMKTTHFWSRRGTRGFTLIELLVVIAIIGILAALLLPALTRARRSAQISRAKLEIGQIVSAIATYDTEYSHYPVSAEAMNAAAANNDDVTFGAVFAGVDTRAPASGKVVYQTNNCEIMAVLLDVEYWPASPSVPTINKGHVKNPQKTKFLNAKQVNDTVSPGVGTDGIYRDPWGQPYNITLDLNNDDKAADSIYRLQSVSQQTPGSPTGFNGLINSTDANGNGNHFFFNGPVMVWSIGPDKLVSNNSSARVPPNKDNIGNWMP